MMFLGRPHHLRYLFYLIVRYVEARPRISEHVPSILLHLIIRSIFGISLFPTNSYRSSQTLHLDTFKKILLVDKLTYYPPHTPMIQFQT